jgi:hypothetical protein
MSLLLTGSQDQALLAMAIQEAHEEAQKQRGFVGRTAVQKIMYFLKAIGVPMDYRFDIYHYGPYCEEVSRDVEWLMADEVIAELSDNRAKYSNYAPGPAMWELLSGHEESIKPFRADVQAIVRALVPLRPERLELIATLDYLYRMKRASGGGGPWKDAVVSRFHEVKGDKFPTDEVRRTYDAMINARLVEP